ncbi:MAG: type II toxin-antitoxin system PemK/MazF family toxin [bacterium]
MARENIKRGSTVLVRYPFSDLSSIKVRPAVIITSNELIRQIDDVLCLFISSSIPDDLLKTDYVLETTHPSFAHTGLKFRSIFRTHKIVLLHRTLVLRVLGELSEELLVKVNERLKISLGIP